MAGLRFEADLELTSEGRTVTVRNDGDALVVTTDDWYKDLRTLRSAAGPVARPRLGALARSLEDSGATIRIDAPGGPLLSLGAGIEPGLLRRPFNPAPFRWGRLRVFAVSVVGAPRVRLVLGVASVLGVGVLWRLRGRTA